MIRTATVSDAEAICNIYNYYVRNTVITFEEEDVPAAEMQQRIEDVLTKYTWLVYESDGIVLGYAYAGSWKVRKAYRHTVEASVYLHPEHTGKGMGKLLYTALFEKLAMLDVHAVIGGVALPNEPSIKLHEHFGFEQVAHFRETGFKFNRWIDVGYWEKLLNKNP